MHDSQTTLILTALLFLVLPVMVWLVLRQQPQRLPVAVWCLGSASAGVALVLMGLRPWLSPWLSHNVANTLLLGSFLGWGQSLRMLLGQPWPWRVWWLAFLACALFYSALFAWATPGVRGSGMRVLLSLLSFDLAVCAWHLSRQTCGVNARTIAVAYLLLGVAMTAHALWPGGAMVSPNPFSKTWDASLVALTALVTAMVGNFAFVGMMLDLLAREQLQAFAAEQIALQTRLLDAQLQDMDRRRQMLIVSGSLAHEISQPLTAATMNTELAQSHWEADPKAVQTIHALLDKVQDSVDRTSRILTRVRGGLDRGALMLRPVDLRQVLKQSLAQLEPDLRRTGVSLVQPKQDEPVICQGDALALSQVLVNLIRNAAQAMQGLTVRQLGVRCFVEQGQAVVEVSDTGPGFSAESLQRWGEAFVSTHEGGLGLGLAISRDLVEKHGGHLILCNRPGGGLQAKVSIPLAVRSAA